MEGSRVDPTALEEAPQPASKESAVTDELVAAHLIDDQQHGKPRPAELDLPARGECRQKHQCAAGAAILQSATAPPLVCVSCILAPIVDLVEGASVHGP
jgi:hypothetical protein